MKTVVKHPVKIFFRFLLCIRQVYKPFISIWYIFLLSLLDIITLGLHREFFGNSTHGVHMSLVDKGLLRR